MFTKWRILAKTKRLFSNEREPYMVASEDVTNLVGSFLQERPEAAASLRKHGERFIPDLIAIALTSRSVSGSSLKPYAPAAGMILVLLAEERADLRRYIIDALAVAKEKHRHGIAGVDYDNLLAAVLPPESRPTPKQEMHMSRMVFEPNSLLVYGSTDIGEIIRKIDRSDREYEINARVLNVAKLVQSYRGYDIYLTDLYDPYNGRGTYVACRSECKPRPEH